MFFRRWIEDIRTKTKGMSGSERAEYIAEYYWYHILLLFLGIGLVVLIGYHVTAGRRTVSFACVIVNEKTDYERDDALVGRLAEAMNLSPERVRVDSDYHISYTGHIEVGNNESDYEKFFFGWSMGELDAVVMPASFFRYCQGLSGKFRTVSADGADAVPLGSTQLADVIRESADDPMLIVFPSEGKHEKEAEDFLRYITDGG